MRFARKNEFVIRVRARARKHGCQKCHRMTELGIKGPKALTQMARDGASIRELKDAIRTLGWYCRKCVRKSKGTATTSTLRDQFPEGPEGTRAFYRHLWETHDKAMYERKGWGVEWNDDGSFRPTVKGTV